MGRERVAATRVAGIACCAAPDPSWYKSRLDGAAALEAAGEVPPPPPLVSFPPAATGRHGVTHPGPMTLPLSQRHLPDWGTLGAQAGEHQLALPGWLQGIQSVSAAGG